MPINGIMIYVKLKVDEALENVSELLTRRKLFPEMRRLPILRLPLEDCFSLLVLLISNELKKLSSVPT